MCIKMIDKKAITNIIFDVDGTIYRKDIEYNPRLGSIQTAHDFFKYLAHQMLSEGTEPKEVSESLAAEYKSRVNDGTLKEKVASIENSVIKGWDEIVDKEGGGSNGKAFDAHYKLKANGHPNFLHRMLSNIDFRRTLDRDPKLLETFDYLEAQGYGLGFLTSEVYSTIEDVAVAMDFDLRRFHIGNDINHPDLFSETDDRHYPIICRNNSIAKPSTDGFDKVKRILGVEDSRTVVYVGDSKKKDVIPPL